MNDIDPDWAAHCAETERDMVLSKAEEFIYHMDRDDMHEFFEGLYVSTELMQAKNEFDEHEFGAVIFDALREHAKGIT